MTTRRRSFSERSTTIKKSLFQGLRLKKQHSTGELEKRGTSSSIRSTGSSASWRSTESSQSGMTNVSQHTDSNASFVAEVNYFKVSNIPLNFSEFFSFLSIWIIRIVFVRFVVWTESLSVSSSIFVELLPVFHELLSNLQLLTC